MANLDDADREDLWAHFMREQKTIMRETGNSGLTKVQLRNIINDIDVWLNANKLDADASIRQPERGIATNALKFHVLAVVSMRRALKAV